MKKIGKNWLIAMLLGALVLMYGIKEGKNISLDSKLFNLKITNK